MESTETAQQGGLTRRIMSSALFYGAGRFIPKLVSLVMLPIYTRYLTTHDYGILHLAILTHTTLNALSRFGLPGAIGRFAFDFQDRKERYTLISSVLWFLLITSGAIFTIGVLCLEPLSKMIFGDQSQGTSLLFLVLIASFWIGPQECQRRWIQVEEKAWVATLLSLVSSTLHVGLALYCLVWQNEGLRSMLIALAFTQCVIGVQALVYLRYALGTRPDATLFRQCARYASGVYPSHLAATAGDFLTPWILSWIAGYGATGVLSIAMKLSSPLLLVIAAFGSAFAPVYFDERIRDEGGSSVKRLHEATQNIFGYALIAYVGIALGAPLILKIAATEEYFAAWKLTGTLGLISLLRLLNVLFSAELYFHKKTRGVGLASVLGIVVQLCILWPLANFLGELGAAIAMVLGAAIYVGGCAWLTRQEHPESDMTLTYIRPLLLTVVYVLFASLVMGFQGSPQAVMGCGICFGLLWLFVFVRTRPEILQRLIRPLKNLRKS